MRQHRFELQLRWAGDRGSGTSGWRDYGRDAEIHAEAHPVLLGSAARAFHGDAARWNPEELLLAALAQCHMVAFLREAALAGVVVIGYRDLPGVLLEVDGEYGAIAEAVLRPEVDIVSGDPALALALHDTAAAKCFVANSVRFPVRHEARVRVVDRPGESEGPVT